ncbi:hypothetical protein LSM04_008810 [Trypanosoma melophagium]|uniref:uncharacterized protein n=1 Tax=Trypanosoma melophagium TaxID=715481 RepID=UPI00351A6817|nr:hypothetical protein LSM04_008810 [Trypanosoma melophagium]
MAESNSALSDSDELHEVSAAINKYMEVMNEDLQKLLENKVIWELDDMAIFLVKLFEEMRKALDISPLWARTLPARREMDVVRLGATVSLQIVECAPVRETSTVVRGVDEDGNKVINYYSLQSFIGRGAYWKGAVGNKS